MSHCTAPRFSMTAMQSMARPTGRRAWHRSLIAAGVLALAAGVTARADSSRQMPAKVTAAYTQECASCHLAYPPAMLPARSWQRLMGRLDKHFGSDASLDAATLQQIGNWLQAHAGTYKRVNEEPPQDRITRSAWFERKHRKIDPAVWKLSSVESAAHCAACHSGAEQGVFDDDRLRYPVGMDARMRRSFED